MIIVTVIVIIYATFCDFFKNTAFLRIVVWFEQCVNSTTGKATYRWILQPRVLL